MVSQPLVVKLRAHLPLWPLYILTHLAARTVLPRARLHSMRRAMAGYKATIDPAHCLRGLRKPSDIFRNLLFSLWLSALRVLLELPDKVRDGCVCASTA